jgi:hypothetical protein
VTIYNGGRGHLLAFCVLTRLDTVGGGEREGEGGKQHAMGRWSDEPTKLLVKDMQLVGGG